MNLEVILRPLRESDRNLIGHSWGIHSYDCTSREGQTRAELRRRATLCAMAMFDDPDAMWAVLVSEHDEDKILGYACAKGPTLHWVHIVSTLRGMGLARDILIPSVCPDWQTIAWKTDSIDAWPILKNKPFLPSLQPVQSQPQTTSVELKSKSPVANEPASESATA